MYICDAYKYVSCLWIIKKHCRCLSEDSQLHPVIPLWSETDLEASQITHFLIHLWNALQHWLTEDNELELCIQQKQTNIKWDDAYIEINALIQQNHDIWTNMTRANTLNSLILEGLFKFFCSTMFTGIIFVSYAFMYTFFLSDTMILHAIR